MSQFLGIDCCTRKIIGVIIDTNSNTVHASVSVPYSDLRDPDSIKDGIFLNQDPLIKHSDPLLWLDALDKLFQNLSNHGHDLSQIDAISGCAQQHGTVYLNEQFLSHHWLKNDSSSLSRSISPILTRKTSPIWMDSSTFEECREISANIGGDDIVRRICGSSPTERFAGPQIRKFANYEPDSYNDTSVIHLVSSFLTSVLIGMSSSIDSCDAVGMNLMDINKLDWDKGLMDATAPDLSSKLPRISPNSHIAGILHPYFQRYGFRDDVPVVNFTGDNPSILVGIGGWKGGLCIVNLGTSDNFFAATDKPVTDPMGYGHLFLNPAGRFMPLTCFKNGTLARDAIRSEFRLNNSEFDVDAFELTPPGNNGNILLPYITDEITPQAMNVNGIVHDGNTLFRSHKDASAIVRALVEAQAMTMKLHTGWFSHKVKELRVTGSMSDSLGVCQVLADVFNSPVERMSHHNAAAQGAAMRAAQALNPDEYSWGSLSKAFAKPVPKKTVYPIKQNVEIYKSLIVHYAELERSITGENCNPELFEEN